MITPNRTALDWVVLTLVLAMIPQFTHMPLHLVAVAAAPILWRIAAQRRDWKPPGLVVRLVLAGTALGLLLATYGGLLGRRAAVSLLTLMLALKLIEAYKLRDARVIVTMSLFLAGTQFLFQQGVLMVLYGAAVIACALVAMVHLQRQEAFAPHKRPPRVGRSMFAEIGYSVKLIGIAMPFAIALFLLFPRWGSPLWGVPEAALDSRTGLSDEMAPGSIAQLYMDDSPAFRVDFHGDMPQNHQMYWRGPVFWEFDGRTWRPGYWGRNILAATRSFPANARWRYRVQLEPTEQRWLFALDYPAAVPTGARLTLDYQLLTRRPVTQLRVYEMASDPGFVDSPELRASFRNAALQLPAGFNPRTEALMAEWKAEAPSTAALVQRTLDHFRNEDFHYVLDPPPLGRDSVDDFLFDTRRGFCEHYASAFTVMMRMAGVPARVVTGYQGGYYSELGDYFLVRHSDAHAWSEVWLEGIGWTRIDPTAAVSPLRVDAGAMRAFRERRHLLDFEWLRGARNLFDVIQRGWNDWVITFSSDRQSTLLRPFGLQDLGVSGLMIMLGVALTLAAFLLYPLLRRLDAGSQADPAVRLWRRFLKRLQRAGLHVQPGEGALEVARRAIQRWPDEIEPIRRISAMFMQWRYMPDPPDYLPIVLRRAVARYRPGRSGAQA